MPEQSTVGDLVAAFLEAYGVSTAFGVISIHNMPILDAIARRNRIRFVPARGEAGAVNMADAYARVSGGLGVGITSTGVAAGNAAGSLIEALIAGSPVLHLTGQVELPYLDRNRAYLHETRNQPQMLASISKASFRIWSAEQALGVLHQAALTALTPPTGPVSVEIPIDVQAASASMPDNIARLVPPIPDPDAQTMQRLADLVAGARRPLLWLGGGAKGAAAPALRLADLGMGIVTSVHGRGIVPEDHPLSLGAFNIAPPVEAFFESCDLMIVAGSRLRGNETLTYTLKLPARRVQIDVDPGMNGRAYSNALFVCGDAASVLERLGDRIAAEFAVDPGFARDLGEARAAAVKHLREGLGVHHERLLDQLRARFPRFAPWVRDVTLANSTWGNRYLDLHQPRQGVHALGGGIGQGLPMAIGAALAARGPKTVALAGDGGLMLSLGELATAVQERANLVLILMNDRGYGVIRNIQDAHYGGRRRYVDLHTPDFAGLCRALSVPYWKVDRSDRFGESFDAAVAVPGPALVEVDMKALGPFARPFAGPPVRAPA